MHTHTHTYIYICLVPWPKEHSCRARTHTSTHIYFFVVSPRKKKADQYMTLSHAVYFSHSPKSIPDHAPIHRYPHTTHRHSPCWAHARRESLARQRRLHSLRLITPSPALRGTWSKACSTTCIRTKRTTLASNSSYSFVTNASYWKLCYECFLLLAWPWTLSSRFKLRLAWLGMRFLIFW